MNKKLFTYKKSGVDIRSADKFVKYIKYCIKKKGKNRLNNIVALALLLIFHLN